LDNLRRDDLVFNVLFCFFCIHVANREHHLRTLADMRIHECKHTCTYICTSIASYGNRLRVDAQSTCETKRMKPHTHKYVHTAIHTSNHPTIRPFY
jgi:hypothetical protein